jgi:hypothetical protein
MPWRWIGLCLCVCLNAIPAQAQTADDLAAARTHFEAATRAFRAGDLAGACRGFERSYELSKRVDLLYNLGRCREELSQWREALTAYRGYLAGKPSATDRKFVEAHIAGIERKLEAPSRGSGLTPASGPSLGTPPGPTPVRTPGARDAAWRPPAYAAWVALGLALAAAGTGMYFGLHTMDRGASTSSAASAAAPATACFAVAGVAAATAGGLALWRWLAPRRRAAVGLGPGRLVVAVDF